jgi:hypothetical protein
MPIYFSWFITALLFGKWWSQQSQPTAKWAPFILRMMAMIHRQVRNSAQLPLQATCRTQEDDSGKLASGFMLGAA